MHKQKNSLKSSGFTIIELLIVIVIIAILAAITLVAYNGIQQQARNSKRVSDMNQIQKALELYAVDNGSYPKQGAAAPDSVGASGLPESILKLPKNVVLAPGAANDHDFLDEVCYGDGIGTNCYGYQAKHSDGTTCWQTGTTCSSYILWYKLEGQSKASSITGGSY